MICYNCGNEVTTEGTNCPFCGSPLSPDAGNQQNFNQQYGNPYQQPGSNQGYQQNYGNQQRTIDGYDPQTGWNTNGNGSMDAKTASIICYLTWIGFLIAVVSADHNHPFFRHHLNNAIVIYIASLIMGGVCLIPILGWIVAIIGEIFLFVCIIMGIVGACNGETNELPLIGNFKLLK